MAKKDEALDPLAVEVDGWDFSEDEKVKGNWFKFEHVGQKLVGTLLDVIEVPPKEQFPTSLTFVIRKNDGEEVKWSHKKYKDEVRGEMALTKVAEAVRGLDPMSDPSAYKIGIEYTGEGEKKPGKFAPKFYEVYLRVVPK